MNSTGLFPCLNTGLSSSQGLAGMTPATLINYKAPVVGTRPMTNHANSLLRPSLFMSMQDKQATSTDIPIRVKMVKSTEEMAQRRFNALYLRQARTEQPLPKNHVLQAKTLNAQRDDTAMRHSSKAPMEKAVESSSDNVSKRQISNAKEYQKSTLSSTLHNLILNYGAKNVSPYLEVKDNDYSYGASRNNFSKAELVDYGSTLEPDMY